MAQIVNRGKPGYSLKKRQTVEVNCPNCDHIMSLDPEEVDIGHIVKCEGCDTKTYYPFEKPWYRKTRVILIWVVSVVISFMIGKFIESGWGNVFESVKKNSNIIEQEDNNGN